MTGYEAPLADMRFVLHEMVDASALTGLDGDGALDADDIDRVLDEAAKFAGRVLAPLNQPGDIAGARLENGVVRMPDGFADAYRRFAEGGWNGVAADPAFGGQGLPNAVATIIAEMWDAANMAFSLCPLLTQSAIALLAAHGSDAQKAAYLAKMVSGEWSGAMCMTEPQAGTDVGALTTRAMRNGDHYLLTGTKIFVTYGDHDMAENIIYMVLARTPDAPAGSRGVSLFLVPRVMVGADGALGAHNDIKLASIEHKLGIQASPTCTLAFGDGAGAVGYLIGEENHGIACMFTMMNEARLAVGLQGVAIAERAYQRARAHAIERRQGARLSDGAPARLIDHADVRRMLMTMKAQIEAMRALVCHVAAEVDVAERHPDAETRAASARRVGLLTPVIKAYCSDIGFDVASLGVQVHGGMGYIEETGAAQDLRDARIAMIYEGANGIQALDLARRKLIADDGRAIGEFLGGLAETTARIDAANGELACLGAPLGQATTALETATGWLRETWDSDPESAAAGATEFLRMLGLVACGQMMAEAALVAGVRIAESNADGAFYRTKRATARFYIERLLPQAAALLGPITSGAATLATLGDDDF